MRLLKVQEIETHPLCEQFIPHRHILDAWSLLAHFANEVGAERVRQVLKSAENNECTLGMSVFNLGEVAYITEWERGLSRVHELLETIRSFPITLLLAEEKVVLTASHIKANHRLSYSDAFDAATAQLCQGKVING